MWKTMTVRVQDPNSNTLDDRFEELNDFLQDCASGLEAVVDALNNLKNTFELYDFSEKPAEIIDQQVYDRNDILKKDAYFAETVWSLIDDSLYKLNIKSEVEDCDFIQTRVSKQYLNQYHDYYMV